MSTVTVHTGNINELQQVVTKRHASSSKELTAAFKELSASNVKLREEHGVYSPAQIEAHTFTNDIKDTLKVFLPSFNTSDLASAVLAYHSSMQLNAVAQLIVSFPAQLSEDLTDDEWIKSVLPIWKEAETLFDQNKVDALGVADLDVDRLRLLCNAAVNRAPQIVHYSIDGCCTVPPDLVDYAKEQNIQILTHNDPRYFEESCALKENVAKMVEGFDANSFNESWIARYTIFLRSRSVVAARGYLVNFKRTL